MTPGAANDAALRVDLSAGYGSRVVLEGIQFELEAGVALGFVGASGTGKSTLALALLGLQPFRGGWARGKVLLGGRNLLALPEGQARQLRGREIALIPQSPLSALNGAITLQAHFAAAWEAHERSGADALEARLNTLLPEVQLPVDRLFLARRPGQLSVGQAQRVCIALALLHRPAVLLADEPTSALDPATQAEILRLLGGLCRSTGTALLYISHDLLSVLQLCDQLAVLDGGRLVEQLAIEQVGTHVHHPALAVLLGALPVPARVVIAHRSGGHDGL